MFKKSRILIPIVALSLSTLSTFASANNEDYISANGVKIELGQSQRYLESKLGIPQREHAEMIGWDLKNGNALTARFDEYGLSNVTISGSKPDFLYAHGIKVTLGQDSLTSAEKKHTHGCYHQMWGEGLIGEYVVRSGPEGSWNLMFNSWGDEDQKALKNKKLSSISIGYDMPIGEEKYCTY